MRHDAFHFNMAEGACVEHASGEFERFGEIIFVMQLMDCWDGAPCLRESAARPRVEP